MRHVGGGQRQIPSAIAVFRHRRPDVSVASLLRNESRRHKNEGLSALPLLEREVPVLPHVRMLHQSPQAHFMTFTNNATCCMAPSITAATVFTSTVSAAAISWSVWWW
jgi:hypothetical protein